MNVYQKLAKARLQLKQAGLKQSGKNKGVGFSYFDLCDILPQTTSIENELGLLSIVSFTETEGTLTVYNTEKPDESIVFCSPLKGAELRGCHPVQNLGASETYVRRYLYLLAYEIVETEALDKGQESESNDKNKPSPKPQQKSKARRIAELIKGSDLEPAQITQWIEMTYGSPLKVNELTDEQFNKLYTAMSKYVKGES